MRRIAIILCTLLFGWTSSRGQDVDDIYQLLIGQGFEDLKATLTSDTIFLSIEDHAYRGTFRGAAVALLALGQHYPDMKQIELVITEYQLPQVAIHAHREAGLWQVHVDYTISPILKRLQSRPRHNNSAWRFDLTANPIMSLDNHRFDVLYEYTVSIAPTIETTLWPGNRITLMPVFPIASNVFKSKPEGYIHVGIAAIQQDVFISDRLRAQLSGGMFLRNLMGFNTILTYRAGNALTFGVKAALLGDAYVEADKYHFGSLDKVSVLGQASYYHAPTQIEAGLTGGRFGFGAIDMQGYDLYTYCTNGQAQFEMYANISNPGNIYVKKGKKK